MLEAAFSVTSNSTICTWPSAKTSVWRAAGTPIVREIACAVSTSDETMKSTSSWPSRQTSRYSGFVVRTTVVVRGRARLRDHRGDDVRLVARGAGDQQVGLGDPGGREHAPAGAVSLDGVHVVALRDRGEPLLVEVEDRQLVLFVESLHDRRADLAGADDEDLHVRRLLPPSSNLVAIVRRVTSRLALGVRRRPRRRLWRGSVARSKRSSSRERSQAGFAQPVYITGAKGEPGRLYVVEQGGRIRVLESGRLRAAPFLDIRNLVPAGGEQGLLWARVPPELPEGTARFYVQYTGPQRGHAGGRVPLERQARAAGAARQLFSSATRTGTTTAACSRSARTAGCTCDGRRRRGRRPGEPRAEPALALRQAVLDRRRHEAGVADRRARPAEPVAVLVRPAQRRPLHRRRRPGRARGDRLHPRGRARASRTTAGTSTRAAAVRGQGDRPGRLVFPVAEYGHGRGLLGHRRLRLPRAANPALRGRYIYGDYGSGTIWSFASSAARRRRTGARRSASRTLSSFGEDAAGELYATSLDGTVYRIRV